MAHVEHFNLWQFGEEEACRFLRKKGCKILDRNFQIPQGEIDIIARLDKIVIFVEVRTRSADTFAEPWKTVGFRKRQHLRTAAKAYIQQKSIWNAEFRFDVISIVLNDSLKPEIDWIQNAF